MVAIEAAGDFLIERGVGEHVAGKLLERELVERLVAIEGGDDGIAVAPHVAAAVILIAVGIGVTGGVEPTEGHALAIARRGEKAVHNFFVGAIGFVVQEGVDFGGSGREAGEIERDAADEGFAIGFGRGAQILFFEAGEHEGIDGIVHPGGVFDVAARG